MPVSSLYVNHHLSLHFGDNLTTKYDLLYIHSVLFGAEDKILLVFQ